MSFGVTPEGFVRKTLADIKQELADAQHAAPALGPALDTDDESALGQMNGTFASALAEAWEVIEEAYHGFDPDSAEDYLLVLLSALTGTRKRGATHGTVLLTVSLDSGTTLPAGSIAAVDGRPDITVETDVDVDGTAGGDFPVSATFTGLGTIAAFAGTITQIVTPFTGWTAVTNANDAIKGREADTNITLRARREAELAIRGGSTVRAIRADVTAVDGVESVFVLENTTDAYDVNGLPPHSFEVLIDDGDTPAASDDAVAQAIFDGKPAGIRAFGGQTGTATDDNSDTHAVDFSRVTLKPVYFTVTLTTDPVTYPADGDDQVVAAVVAKGQSLTIGEDVIALRLAAACFAVAGVTDVPLFKLGFAPAPSGTANLVVALRERATFDTANGGVA
jgi:uncharacterized phage protein gp47/JayE